MDNKKSNKLALFLLMFNMFITFSGIGLIIPVMPKYLELFGAAGQVLGLLIATFAFAQFVFSPIAGNLSDKYGRKQLIVIGLIIYGISQIFFGLSTEIWMLFVSRFLSGLGAAFIGPPIMAFVADVTSYEDRGKGMGMIGAAISFGFLIGPGIGGLLSHVSLQFPFYVAGAVSLITAAISAFLLPNVKHAMDTSDKQDHVINQLIHSVKTPYFVILLIVFGFSFGIANYQTTLALFVTDKFNYTPADISIILTVGGAMGVIIQVFVITPLFKRFGEMKVILVNLLVATICMLLLIYVNGFALILLVAIVFSIATSLIRPAVNTLISKLADTNQGFAAGMNNAYMSLGNMIGPALAGILFDIDRNIPYYLGAVILLTCFSLAYLWALKKASHLMRPETSN